MSSAFGIVESAVGDEQPSLWVIFRVRLPLLFTRSSDDLELSL